MNLITPTRLIELKAKVKKECQRRNISIQGGPNRPGQPSQIKSPSLTQYATTDYDYNIIPKVNEVIYKEHFNKNTIPLNALNSKDNPIQDISNEVIKDIDFLNLETNVIKYSKRNIHDNKGSDCSVSCTGLCFSCQGQCSSSCSGCTGCTSCSGCSGCTNACTGCTNACGNTGCANACNIGCSNTCSNVCEDSCSDGCTHSCHGDCSGVTTNTHYPGIQ